MYILLAKGVSGTEADISNAPCERFYLAKQWQILNLPILTYVSPPSTFVTKNKININGFQY